MSKLDEIQARNSETFICTGSWEQIASELNHEMVRRVADVAYLLKEIKRLRTALEQIANPIGYLQAEAVKEGAKLDGAMAVLIESMPSWYRERARKALLPDANQVGEMNRAK